MVSAVEHAAIAVQPQQRSHSNIATAVQLQQGSHSHSATAKQPQPEQRSHSNAAIAAQLSCVCLSSVFLHGPLCLSLRVLFTSLCVSNTATTETPHLDPLGLAVACVLQQRHGVMNP